MSSYGIRESAGAGEWIMGAVARNPEGLLLLAAGAALLLRSGRGQSRTRSHAEVFGESQGRRTYAHRDESTGIGDRVSETARRAGEYVSETTDRVSETARSYASSAADFAGEATRITAEQSRHVANQARETADYLVQEQPWAVALAGLAAGATVAAVLPPTQIERRTLGDAGERLRSAAETAGERVMEAGMQAGERLGEIAEDRGLTKEGLKQAAREVGETFGTTLAGEEASSSPKGQPEDSPRTQTRQAQSGGTSTQSGKGSKSPSISSSTTPRSGGRS